jgi:hypothetical protein
MALHKGATVIYKTASSFVPAITTAHYTTGTEVDTAAASVTSADLVIVGVNGTGTYLGSVTRFTGSTAFADRNAVTTGQYYIPT